MLLLALKTSISVYVPYKLPKQHYFIDIDFYCMMKHLKLNKLIPFYTNMMKHWKLNSIIFHKIVNKKATALVPLCVNVIFLNTRTNVYSTIYGLWGGRPGR